MRSALPPQRPVFPPSHLDTAPSRIVLLTRIFSFVLLVAGLMPCDAAILQRTRRTGVGESLAHLLVVFAMQLGWRRGRK